MNYQDSVRYLLTLGSELAAPRQPAPAGSARAQKFDLRNITTLAEHLGRPHRAAQCAHVAGTNGKGSTAAMLASICQQAGRKTGLYTSPHLERINERIRINGEEISDHDFAATFTQLHALIEKLLASGELAAHPTYFECLTAMAFDYFARQRVDFAVFEVGMGGRLDATNIVEPQVCIITQIDFDHENYLGHSIPQIAAEKAGIIKRGVPVICAAGRAEARAVIQRRCQELNAQFVDVESGFQFEQMESHNGWYRANLVSQRGQWPIRLEPSLAGNFQLLNSATAAAAAMALKIEPETIAQGIRNTHWPGRLERLQRSPLLYLDGAHNPAGAIALRDFWRTEIHAHAVILVYGAVRDKAVDEVTGWLYPYASKIILTAPRQARAISPQALLEMAGYYARRAEVVAEPEAAVERALELAKPDDAIFVTGSLYLVGDVRRWWNAQHAPQAAVRAV